MWVGHGACVCVFVCVCVLCVLCACYGCGVRVRVLRKYAKANAVKSQRLPVVSAMER